MLVQQIDHRASLDPTTLKVYSDEVCHGLVTNGFLDISGTGLPEMAVEADGMTREMFALPEEYLLKRYSTLDRQRGYTPKGKEKAAGKDTPDPKRHWMTGNPEILRPGTDRLDAMFGPSLIIEEFPEYTPLMERMLLCSLAVSRGIMRAVEVGFGQPEGSLVNLTIGSDSSERSLCYDNDVPPGTILAEEHFDINAFTILVSTQIAGVELWQSDGWHPVETRPGSVLGNTGEMWPVIPAYREIKPIKHRVVAGPRMAKQRLVYAAFIHFLRNIILDPSRPVETHVWTWFRKRIHELYGVWIEEPT